MSAEQVRRAVVRACPAGADRGGQRDSSRCSSPTWHPTRTSTGRTSRVPCRCCRTRCSPPGSTATAERSTVADYLAERRDQGSAHPVRRTGLRESCAGAAAARPTVVPPSRACSRRAAAEPRGSVSLGELLSGIGDGADAERVLAVFIDERMITVDTGAARLTHDALLTAWPRLRAWIEESAEELRDRRRIAVGRAGLGGGRPGGGALWRGSQLAVAREWAEPTRTSARRCCRSRASSWTRRSPPGPPASGSSGGAPRRLRSIVAVLTVLVARGLPARRLRVQASASRPRAARDVAITRPAGCELARRRHRAPTQLRSPRPAAGRPAQRRRLRHRAHPAGDRQPCSSRPTRPPPRESRTRPASCRRSPSPRTGGCSPRLAPTGRCGCGT